MDKKKEKVDYSLIFGDPEEIQQKKEEIIQKSVIKKIRSRDDRGGGASGGLQRKAVCSTM